MGRSSPNTLLAALLVEARWNAGELARAVNALGRAHMLDLHYDRTSVAHWLSGSRPRPPVPDLVADSLTTRTGRMVTAQDTGLARPASSQPSPSQVWPGLGNPVEHLNSLVRTDTDPARRTILLQSVHAQPAYPLNALGRLAWPSTPAEPVPRRAGRTLRGTAADVERLHLMTVVFAGLSEQHGGAHARTALAAYLADDVSLLLNADAPDTLHNEMLIAAAQLTHILATMTADSGHLGLAQRYYRTSLSLSHAGGGRSTYAITLRSMSAQALRLGHHRPAQRLADTALEAAGRSAPPAVLAYLHVQRALTHAHSRQRKAAVSDLATATRQHERSSGPPGPFSAYPQAGLEYQSARAFLALGNSAHGLTALRDSAAHRDPRQRRAAALTHAALAEALLSLGRLEEACAHWHVFLDDIPHLESAQIDRALVRMRANLQPHRRQRHAAVLWKRARVVAAPLRST
ncbi:hypothetical protein ACIP6P_23175 [Streptomyces sp. NPDC088729]|uniref:hypothetical protein n=1 Tax=Streptomyces sp. NPDC088729 TaxID=3365876 RepID=UPI00382E634C